MGHVCGFLTGWPANRHRQRRWDGQVVGCGNPRLSSHADWAQRYCHVRVLFSRRPKDSQQQPGSIRQVMGRGERNGVADAQRAPRLAVYGRVLPGRQAHCHRRWGWDSQDMGGRNRGAGGNSTPGTSGRGRRRSGAADQTTVSGIALKAGLNVLVFKVVNELVDWGGSVLRNFFSDLLKSRGGFSFGRVERKNQKKKDQNIMKTNYLSA